MAIYSANEMIRMIRKKSGLSQEEFCDGICSVQALSNIENGKNGVSPITFDMFISKANINVRPFPCFASEEDFDCFMDLHRADFLIESWQFKQAYKELEKIEKNNFADNKLYYQQWMALNCKILTLSEKCNYEEVLKLIIDALNVTIPNYDNGFPMVKSLSPTEFVLVAMVADCYINMGRLEEAADLLDNLNKLLQYVKVSDIEAFLRAAEISYLQEKLYLLRAEYEELLVHSCEWYKKATTYHRSIPIFHFAYMNAIALYKTGDSSAAINMFQEVIAGASFVNSIFIDVCIEYIHKNTDIAENMYDDFVNKPEDAMLFHKEVRRHYAARMQDGVYSLKNRNVITYGGLLKLLRKRHKLAAEKVCAGLCGKSQYSKIENDKAMPSVILARALLERVGITENLFDFFGNEEEFKYADLSEKIGALSTLDTGNAKEIIDKMKALKISSDKLINQEIIFLKTVFSDSNNKSVQFMEGLKVTKADFEFKNIDSPFTNMEFDIVQHYIRCVLKKEDSAEQGIKEMLMLVKYYESLDYDITQYRVNIPMLYMVMAPHLQKSNNIDEFEKLYIKCKDELMQNHIYIKASIVLEYMILQHKMRIITNLSDSNIIKIAYYAMKLSATNSLITDSIDNKLLDANIMLT